MIVGATREQEQAVRDLFKPGCISQRTMPPNEEGYVRTRVQGRWNWSAMYWVAPDGTVTKGRPQSLNARSGA